MIKGLTEIEKYRVIRPLIGSCDFDGYDMPVIRKVSTDAVNWENLQITGFKNLSSKRDNSSTLSHMFYYDKVLMPLWNNPLKRIPLFQTCAAIATPDFSVYESMNMNEIRHNVYMSRWLGCTWQIMDVRLFLQSAGQVKEHMTSVSAVSRKIHPSYYRRSVARIMPTLFSLVSRS